MVDLAGGLSKLIPPLAHIASGHRNIRGRTRRSRLKSRGSTRASRPGKTALRESGASYRAGRSLKVLAKVVGIGHERLSRLLREPGERLRRQSPSLEETTEMQIRYREGASLEQIDAIPGYSVDTLRAYVLAAGTVLSDATDGESEWSGRSVNLEASLRHRLHV